LAGDLSFHQGLTVLKQVLTLDPALVLRQLVLPSAPPEQLQVVQPARLAVELVQLLEQPGPRFLVVAIRLLVLALPRAPHSSMVEDHRQDVVQILLPGTVSQPEQVPHALPSLS